jgi:hypothetical protein
MFRFTIRDLLWLTVVVALGVAWWVDRRQQESEILRRASIALPDRARWHYSDLLRPILCTRPKIRRRSRREKSNGITTGSSRPLNAAATPW